MELASEIKSQISQTKLQVFYDGLCVVCSKEIDIYRRKDTHNKIEFVDISLNSFDAKSQGLDPVDVDKVFHVKTPQGKIVTGIDGFLAIWDCIDIFKPLSTLAKFPATRPLFDLGYFAFTKARPFLPRKKCDDGTCHI